MMRGSINRRRILGAMACVAAAVAGGGPMLSNAPGQDPERPAVTSKAATAAVDQARTLVADLEAQVERQRAELRRSEASLERARSLLGELEGRPKPAPQNHPQINRNHTAEDRRRLPDQAEAEQMKWAWSGEDATAEACARRLPGGYRATCTPIPGRPSGLTITIAREGRTVASWEGSRYSTFVAANDVLYRADYHPSMTGCDVIAHDLKEGKTLWTAHLWGVFVLAHSQYSNRVELRIDDRHVIAFGDESAGRYIELLDPKTGNTVGQRLLGRAGYAQ